MIDDYIYYLNRLLGGDCFQPVTLRLAQIGGNLSVLSYPLIWRGPYRSVSTKFSFCLIAMLICLSHALAGS